MLVTEMTYDTQQLLVGVREPEGNVHLTRYDERDLPYETVRGASDPGTQTTTRLYRDRAGRVVQVIDDDGGRRHFRFQRGPIFAGLVLADEINRATPKTQSAMLEAMQEHSVTVAGETHALPDPFHVVATQNPIELEGTFPLPEAQLDRFLFRLDVRSPDSEAMARILDATTGVTDDDASARVTAEELQQVQRLVREVLCGSHLVRWVAELVCLTHPTNEHSSEPTRRFVRYGASARAGQAILLGAKARALLAGRPAVHQEDIDACLLPSLRHRVLLGFEADAQQVAVEELLAEWRTSAQRRVSG